jgi:hypothetical protein
LQKILNLGEVSEFPWLKKKVSVGRQQKKQRKRKRARPEGK